MISETACSSQTKLIGLSLHVSEYGLSYSNLTPDPQGAQGPQGTGQNSSFTKLKNFTNKSCHAWLKDDKDFISPSGGPRKTCKAGFLVKQRREKLATFNDKNADINLKMETLSWN